MRPILMRPEPTLAGGAARVDPPPLDHRRFAWDGGVFETAHRPFTPWVEGWLTPRAPVLMVTLRGGAELHELETDDGHRHAAPDVAGSVSFLPGGCTRRLRLRNVAWQWASLTLPADDEAWHGLVPRPFSAARDEVVLAVLAEMTRLHAADGGLDPAYCDAMAMALMHHLARSYWRGGDGASSAALQRLPAWRLRRVLAHVEAHLGDELRIATLAALVGLSPGHFQRAFRATTGHTPLAYITQCRVEAAKRLLADGEEAVGAVAARVGFISQSHFARTFRVSTGLSPRQYRQTFSRSG